MCLQCYFRLRFVYKKWSTIGNSYNEACLQEAVCPSCNPTDSFWAVTMCSQVAYENVHAAIYYLMCYILPTQHWLHAFLAFLHLLDLLPLPKKSSAGKGFKKVLSVCFLNLFRRVYRTMHCLASHVVRLSVMLVDHQLRIDRKSWKLTAQTISLTLSLFTAQRPSTYSQGNMGKFGRD